MKNLLKYFDYFPGELPALLPVVHVTTYRNLERIISNGRIEAFNTCSVINKKVTFFNYGGAFYRLQDSFDDMELPVALMYSADLLKIAETFLPYDSGAASRQMYGAWNKELSRFDKYSVPVDQIDIPGGYIKTMFGGNQNYLNGVSRDLPTDYPQKLHNLSEFYKVDRSQMDKDLDMRRYMLELHFSEPIPRIAGV